VNHIRGGSHTFDDPGRRQWQDPEAILNGIGLKPGMAFADIGCGGGFFALPAARIVGLKGKVYGVDANPDMIAAIRAQAEKEGLTNINLTVGEAEKVIPCEHCADIVFFGIALHDFHDPAKVLKNAGRIIKPNGQLIDLDWKKEDLPIGPPAHIKFSETQSYGLIGLAGFKIDSVKDCGPYHYLITATPIPK
jgi:ubiquinone/menaquinone biosynthesis C-methylase UbiE